MKTSKEDRFFSGEVLYGDDFTLPQIEEWYRDEQEAFTNLYVRPQQETYRYPYHALDIYHAYRHLPPNIPIGHALGIGSATGDEFLPISNLLQQITILEPSSLYETQHNIGGIPARWVKPEVSGDILFPDQTFDLITCFSVLHHIPNVSFVIEECERVLKPGGFLLIREPITSMGDWRFPRKGVTKRERGIPLKYFHEVLSKTGLRIVYTHPCNFPVIEVGVRKFLGTLPYRSMFWTRLDALISMMFFSNYHYHRTNLIQKLASRTICFVLMKTS